MCLRTLTTIREHVELRKKSKKAAHQYKLQRFPASARIRSEILSYSEERYGMVDRKLIQSFP